MTKVWKITSSTPRMGGGGPPLKEYFLVAISDQSAAGAVASLAPIKEAAAKMAQKAAEYQDTPKGDQQCSNCSLFQEPNACTLVDGDISPSGWCKFWVKKAG